ncbi:MAG TPA: SRPBCC family protein [Candidatus Kapabacteria bacterium]|nr:SRPBCC family protein [Candidatus Kapabacteria bacterium]
MKIYTVERKIDIAAPIQAVFGFHLDFKNLALISPSWMKSELLDEEGMGSAKQQRLKVTLFGAFPSIWVVATSEYEPPTRLTDLLRSGPLPYFKHTRTFSQPSQAITELSDKLEYALPFGFVGRIANTISVHRMMIQMFEHRHEMTKQLLEEKYYLAAIPLAQ